MGVEGWGRDPGRLGSVGPEWGLGGESRGLGAQTPAFCVPAPPTGAGCFLFRQSGLSCAAVSGCQDAAAPVPQEPGVRAPSPLLPLLPREPRCPGSQSQIL